MDLDFRGAIFSGETIEINSLAFWGAVEIVVPPGVHIDTKRLALLGGFDQSAEFDAAPPRAGPPFGSMGSPHGGCGRGGEGP